MKRSTHINHKYCTKHPSTEGTFAAAAGRPHHVTYVDRKQTKNVILHNADLQRIPPNLLTNHKRRSIPSATPPLKTQKGIVYLGRVPDPRPVLTKVSLGPTRRSISLTHIHADHLRHHIVCDRIHHTPARLVSSGTRCACPWSKIFQASNKCAPLPPGQIVDQHFRTTRTEWYTPILPARRHTPQ